MVVLTKLLLSYKPSNPKNLYKHLLRSFDTLPKLEGKFYKQSVRKEYDQHWDEEDPERIEQIMERAVRDKEWILAKYSDKK